MSTLITMLMKIKPNIIKNWPYTPDHPYRILITGGSGSGKKSLLNLIENQTDIDKIYLYAKDPCESQYQYLINKREGVGINHLKILKHLLIIQMICMMLIKVLMITILINKIGY